MPLISRQLLGAIDHTFELDGVHTRMFVNLNDRCELVLSFYKVMSSMLVVEPLRWVYKRLPKKSVVVAATASGALDHGAQDMERVGLANATHTSYGWVVSHEYQCYSREAKMLELFRTISVEYANFNNFQKVLCKISKCQGVAGSNEVHVFSAVA